MRQVTQWLHFYPMPTKYLAATHRGHQHVKVMPTPCIFQECFTTHSSNLRKCLYQISSHARPHVNLCPLVNFSVWKLEALKFHGPKIAHCSASRSNRDIRKALRPRQLRAWPDDMPQRQQKQWVINLLKGRTCIWTFWVDCLHTYDEKPTIE
jgi:hypothetical protein